MFTISVVALLVIPVKKGSVEDMIKEKKLTVGTKASVAAAGCKQGGLSIGGLSSQSLGSASLQISSTV